MQNPGVVPTAPSHGLYVGTDKVYKVAWPLIFSSYRPLIFVTYRPSSERIVP